ncbi:glycosyltransferase [Streptomyces sp. AC563]|uniref:glycosyltransferase n=1 Tax=Streptomyces buecherae TaxID=2763006 RepID=UPI00164CF81B|nr:glycosyltransferase [Streptomyces buecherae]MBC3993641.1 glycosyltransferase [Streptomyces buecherae]
MLTSHHPHAPDAPPAPNGTRQGISRPGGHVLAVGIPGRRLERLTQTLRSTGHEVSHAEPGQVSARIQQAPPDAIVALDDERAGLAVVREVRAAPAGRALPLLVVTARSGPAGVVDVLRHGADDCVAETSDPAELSARIEAKLRRVPVPVESLLLDPRTGLYSSPHFLDELDRELGRPLAGRRAGVLAVVAVAEMPALEARLGQRVRREVAERLAGVAERTGGPSDRLGWDDDGHLLMLLPGVDEDTARATLQDFARQVAGTRFIVADENVRLTPAVGWAPLADCARREQPVERAKDAVAEAIRHRDLRPVLYAPWMRAQPDRHRRPRRSLGAAVKLLLNALSPLLVLALGVGAPFVFYQQTYAHGWDVGSAVYWVVVAGLLVSAALIVLECLYALDATPRPQRPAQPYPPASAVIAAYLPNEAATIVDTVESFLQLDYPGELEIVLAYNTPHPLPVEETLREIARRDPRLVLLPVVGSTSKAQNINAAVTRVRGEMVGIFDADHHPARDAFQHAWHWLSNGYDVVQGHCVIRNGDSSWVARLVAVEFEAIYAVSHPGRTRMYGFGVFGGSNGFWRTDLLARTRMHGSMLTEDIDSTLRALGEGARFAMDRTLISRELAPTQLGPLWNQRSRWAQGWLQVSLKHLWRALRSPVFTARQKLGLTVLLGWREVQPWLTLQILPILLYSIWRAGGPGELDWAVPICVLAMLFTLSAGVVQACFAWRLAVPELRRRRAWFWHYLFVSAFFYSHFKNIVARQAHLKEALGDRQWRVTPRAAAKAVARP